MQTITLDGCSLTRSQLQDLAEGRARIALAAEALRAVERSAAFLDAQVRRGEPIYGVTTGFGSNADKLLGAHRARDELPGGDPEPRDGSLLEELQHNLILTHAVCVGEAFAPEVVRAMLAIRINTLLRGHSGIRVQTLQALAQLFNRGVLPVVPQLGSVGASGDLAPLSHLAIVLLGGGEAFYEGQRLPGGEALRRAGLAPLRLSYKEGLALNNGTAQMLACAVLAVQRLQHQVQRQEDGPRLGELRLPATQAGRAGLPHRMGARGARLGVRPPAPVLAGRGSQELRQERRVQQDGGRHAQPLPRHRRGER